MPELMSQNAEPDFRQRCYDCFRPVGACFCDAIPSIANQTEVLILQHVKERFHAFNTARIVRKALNNCRLLADQTPALAAAELPLVPGGGILYPGENSVPLCALAKAQRPAQLVILDGTWHHAKTLMRDIPALQQLPRYRLDPEEPSRYQLRREPVDSALSTVEATVQALQILEPQTCGLAQLLTAFHRMVDEQLAHPVRAARVRKRSALPRPSVNIPSVLIHEPENIVVAYGEVSFGGSGVRRKDRSLIYWLAQRLVTGELFAAAIQSPGGRQPDFLQQLELTPADFTASLSTEEFRTAWRRFLTPGDTLCVYNESTAHELRKLTGEKRSVISLKSVNLHRDCPTLDDVLRAARVKPPAPVHRGRVGKRLANAVAYAEYLRALPRPERPESRTEIG